MTTFLIIAVVFLLVLLAAQTWVLIAVVRRNEDLRVDMEDRNRMIARQQKELGAAHSSLTMVLSHESQQVQDMSKALELILSDGA